MPYNGESTWTEWKGFAGSRANSLLSAVREAEAIYDEWTDFVNGRGPTEVATALNITATQRTEINNAFETMHWFQLFLTNNATATDSELPHAKRLRTFS